MGRRARTLGVVAALAIATGALPAGMGPAAAKPRKPPPPPPPSWTVDRVRFEPLDPVPLAVEGLGRYRGTIEVVPVPGAGLGVVNHVAFDDYLRGISEVPVAWPPEAQKAQAVAARTFALWSMGQSTATEFRAAGADICATDSCQVYAGADKDLRPGAEAWAAAVESTRGQVLLYKGSPIQAKYSSSNGGRTVAGGKPYLVARDDPDDKRSPLHRWRASYALADAGRAMGLRTAPSEVRRVGDDMVATVPVDDGTEEHRLPAVDFRVRFNEAVGAPEGLPLALPSVRFDAHTADGGLVVEGRGWGHGIGLSQHGALGKAQRGMKAPEILAAYYGGLKPTTLPAEQLPPVVKVALATDAGSVVLTAPGGRFRVVDGNGAVLAHAASGRWTVSGGAKGRGVRVVPPRDQAGLPSLDVVATEPVAARSGVPLALRLRLGGPDALTTVAVVGPDGNQVQPQAPAVQPAGEVDVLLAERAEPGRYAVAVDRDAGGDRRAAVRLLVEVGRGRGPVASAAALTPATVVTPGALQAGAASLWLSVFLLAVRLRRGPGRQLH